MTGLAITVEWEGTGQARLRLPDGSWCTAVRDGNLWSVSDYPPLVGWTFADVDGLMSYLAEVPA